MTPIRNSLSKLIPDSPQANQTSNRVYPVSTLPLVNIDKYALETLYIFHGKLGLMMKAEV